MQRSDDTADSGGHQLQCDLEVSSTLHYPMACTALHYPMACNVSFVMVVQNKSDAVKAAGSRTAQAQQYRQQTQPAIAKNANACRNINHTKDYKVRARANACSSLKAVLRVSAWAPA